MGDKFIPDTVSTVYESDALTTVPRCLIQMSLTPSRPAQCPCSIISTVFVQD